MGGWVGKEGGWTRKKTDLELLGLGHDVLKGKYRGQVQPTAARKVQHDVGQACVWEGRNGKGEEMGG